MRSRGERSPGRATASLHSAADFLHGLGRMGRRKRRRKNQPTNAGKAGAGAPASFLDGTAYRRAEKAYRRYTHDGAPETNFRNVIDCHDLENNTEDNRRRLRRVAGAKNSDAVLYALDGCPGLYLAPGALTEDEQCELIYSAGSSYQQPPNATNLAAMAQPKSSEPELEPEPESELQLQAPTLDRLRRLRWATLGYQYQWTSRTYEAGKVTEMPSRLSELCSNLAGALGHAMEPQAAIVNYYNPKVLSDSPPVLALCHARSRMRAAVCSQSHARCDRQSTMGGHVDDAELDLSLPLVSLSLGLSAVFLFGGPTREDTPTALWLRSGDAIIVTGEARLCYHGVPRIVEGSCPEFLLDPKRYRNLSTCQSSAGEPGDSTRSRRDAMSGAAGGDETEGFSTALVEYMSTARININVRQLARVTTPEQLAQLIAERSLQDTDQTAMSSVLGSRSVRHTSSTVPAGQGKAVISAADDATPTASSER